MPNANSWQEIETKVHAPSLGLIAFAGISFTVIGVLFLAFFNPPGPIWLKSLFGVAFVFFGGAADLWVLRRIFFPCYIRHASSDVLPDVPTAPVVVEGTIVSGRLTHMLSKNTHGWEFVPATSIQHHRGFIFGFGIPFLILFSGFVAWGFHDAVPTANWIVSGMAGIVLTSLSGVPAFIIIILLFRTSEKNLPKLSIPNNDDNLELIFSPPPDFTKTDLAAGIKWMFVPGPRNQLTFPRDSVAAVQLCPWKYVLENAGDTSIMWAVQGLLVLKSRDTPDYQRLPILLTQDYVGAAKLMQRLAEVLHVPYLFCADAAGWSREINRAALRPPLHTGGTAT